MVTHSLVGRVPAIECARHDLVLKVADELPVAVLGDGSSEKASDHPEGRLCLGLGESIVDRQPPNEHESPTILEGLVDLARHLAEASARELVFVDILRAPAGDRCQGSFDLVYVLVGETDDPVLGMLKALASPGRGTEYRTIKHVQTPWSHKYHIPRSKTPPAQNFVSLIFSSRA